MPNKSIYEKMAEFTWAEKQYRIWFDDCLYDSFTPVESWTDFKKRRFGMSEGYTSRLVAHETGLTFKQLLRRLRLERAASLLVNSGCSAEEAAEAVGYTNQSRFYRNFKEFFGYTPGEYKKGHKKQ